MGLLEIAYSGQRYVSRVMTKAMTIMDFYIMDRLILRFDSKMKGFSALPAIVSSAARLTAKTMTILKDNIKPSIYIGPHTWEPCVPDSLTHRLNPCGHLVVTELLEVCGRNCLVSMGRGLGGIRDLDRFSFCPTCLGNEGALTPTGEQKEYEDIDKNPKFINCDFRVEAKRAIPGTDARLQIEVHNAKRGVRLKGMRCKSVL